MLDTTRKILEQVAADWMNKERDFEQWEHLFDARGHNMFGKTYPLSFSTFRKYAKLEKVTTYNPVTVEELVNLLNECAGDDCYNGSWKYVVKDGKPYEVITGYKLIAINFN